MGKRRFAGSVKGDNQQTEAARYTNGPIVGHIRGWDFGVKVRGVNMGGVDQFEVILTGGSNKPNEEYSLGWFVEEDLENTISIRRERVCSAMP